MVPFSRPKRKFRIIGGWERCDSLFRHTLLRARDWQERAEFGEVCDWWRKGGIGARHALVAIGGAGKTAIADRFLQAAWRLPATSPSSAAY